MSCHCWIIYLEWCTLCILSTLLLKTSELVSCLQEVLARGPSSKIEFISQACYTAVYYFYFWPVNLRTELCKEYPFVRSQMLLKSFKPSTLSVDSECALLSSHSKHYCKNPYDFHCIGALGPFLKELKICRKWLDLPSWSHHLHLHLKKHFSHGNRLIISNSPHISFPRHGQIYF